MSQEAKNLEKIVIQSNKWAASKNMHYCLSRFVVDTKPVIYVDVSYDLKTVTLNMPGKGSIAVALDEAKAPTKYIAALDNLIALVAR